MAQTTVYKFPSTTPRRIVARKIEIVLDFAFPKGIVIAQIVEESTR